MKRSLTAIPCADAVGHSRHRREPEQLAARSSVFPIPAIKHPIENAGGTYHDGSGDGVDMSACLEPIVLPAGICVSRSVYGALRGEAEEDLGEIDVGPKAEDDALAFLTPSDGCGAPFLGSPGAVLADVRRGLVGAETAGRSCAIATVNSASGGDRTSWLRARHPVVEQPNQVALDLGPERDQSHDGSTDDAMVMPNAALMDLAAGVRRCGFRLSIRNGSRPHPTGRQDASFNLC